MTVVELNFIDYLMDNLEELSSLKLENTNDDASMESVFSMVLDQNDDPDVEYCYSIDQCGYIVEDPKLIIHQSTVSRLDEVVERIREGTYVSCRLRKAEQLMDLRDQLIVSTFNALLINKVFNDCSFSSEVKGLVNGGSIIIPCSMWKLVTGSMIFSGLQMSTSIDQIVKGHVGQLPVKSGIFNVYVDFESNLEGTVLLGHPSQVGNYKSAIHPVSTSEVWHIEEHLILQFSNLSNCSIYTP